MDELDIKNRKSIRDFFASLVDSYILKHDADGIMSIFPPKPAFKTQELIDALSDKKNYKLYEEACETIVEYATLLRRNGGIFFPVEEIREYLSEKFVFDKTLTFIADRKKYYYLLKMAFFTGYRRLIKFKESQYISSFNDIIKEKRNNVYYRGQTNSDWRISPSVLRDLNKSVVFNDNYYFKILSKAKLEDKYNELIRTKKSFEKYPKYAFMQHSLSFSPLIDFTKEKEIATSFALSNPAQINVLENKDSAVFDITVYSIFKIDDLERAYTFLHKEFYIDVIDSDYFVLGRTYKLYEIDSCGNKIEKIIFITSIDELLERLRPRFKLFDIPVNDRMKYQKGVFVCFYDCIALRTRVCYELNEEIDLNKSIIKTSDKKEILKGIYNNRKYDQEHLMNPYLIFTEYFF